MLGSLHISRFNIPMALFPNRESINHLGASVEGHSHTITSHRCSHGCPAGCLIPVQSVRPASIDQPACQVITCWLSPCLRRKVPGRMPGWSLHQAQAGRPRCHHQSATYNTSSWWSSKFAIHGSRNHPGPSEGLNPHQGPATLLVRATSPTGAPTD